MDSSQAFLWLEAQLASPVSRDWGRILCSLKADPELLQRWLRLSKEHALAAADAIERFAASGEMGATGALLPDLRAALESFPSPRLAAAVDSVERAQAAIATPLPSAALERAAYLLSNNRALSSREMVAITAARPPPGAWRALFHAMNGVHCVVVLDWKATQQDQLEAVTQLPIWNLQHSNVVESVDFGNDETILVALPKEQMAELKQLAPFLKLAPASLAA